MSLTQSESNPKSSAALATADSFWRRELVGLRDRNTVSHGSSFAEQPWHIRGNRFVASRHEEMIDGEERLIPLTHYLREQPMTFIFIAVTLLVFYLLMWQERRAIRRVMDAHAPKAASHQEGRP